MLHTSSPQKPLGQSKPNSRGNETMLAASGSLDQDGRYAHIWYKPFKNLLLRNQRANGPGLGLQHSGHRPMKFEKMMTFG